MRESSTYQMILDEGRGEGRVEGRAEGEAVGRIGEARRIVLRLGSQRLGAPDAATVATIEAIDELDALENLIARLLTTRSWRELLGDTAR